MWEIYEHKQLVKNLQKIPLEILKKYEIWKDIVELSGPQALKNIKGFRDESLKGNWKGYRSSRLNKQYRVIYQVVEHKVLIKVVDLTAHDYRRYS